VLHHFVQTTKEFTALLEIKHTPGEIIHNEFKYICAKIYIFSRQIYNDFFNMALDIVWDLLQ
jgi:hypothetical protein